MTVEVSYAPEVAAINADKRYPFPFPAADEQSIEVYEIIDVEGVEHQYLVPVQDYYLEWSMGAGRYHLFVNGKVVFTREHSVDATKVMVVRNTLIDQTADMPVDAAFNSRVVEFMLDKHTLIFQEIAYRKCNASTTTPITQTVVYGAYDNFPADVLNFSVQKLFDIAAEIVASADNCEDNLEGT